MNPALPALAVSAALILLLCIGDPKRRRSRRIAGQGRSAAFRKPLSAAVLLPGAYLAFAGDAAAFLIWLGGCSVLGWLVAQLFGLAKGPPACR